MIDYIYNSLIILYKKNVRRTCWKSPSRRSWSWIKTRRRISSCWRWRTRTITSCWSHSKRRTSIKTMARTKRCWKSLILNVEWWCFNVLLLRLQLLRPIHKALDLLRILANQMRCGIYWSLRAPCRRWPASWSILPTYERSNWLVVRLGWIIIVRPITYRYWNLGRLFH